MKWLYRILRLFICPHKWELYRNIEQLMENNATKEKFIGFYIFVLKCKRCGEISFKKSLR